MCEVFWQFDVQLLLPVGDVMTSGKGKGDVPLNTFKKKTYSQLVDSCRLLCKIQFI